ncbi:uncharacterized protein LY79DRAFT_565450 [Colletotrichum navitas]|uniref:Uncharacterized protein n=1 Tax=Colletotrichum navitas TaxID=681940 RepID=A0AAD8PS52_9PEZI|nr:uncharacterized protein LY79DRAFT_565450 [Colletotrichum navitas]KAK1574684.1 hypothetical protein LY79DRAFT_565450 [Colletotrichum navitas]
MTSYLYIVSKLTTTFPRSYSAAKASSSLNSPGPPTDFARPPPSQGSSLIVALSEIPWTFYHRLAQAPIKGSRSGTRRAVSVTHNSTKQRDDRHWGERGNGQAGGLSRWRADGEILAAGSAGVGME